MSFDTDPSGELYAQASKNLRLEQVIRRLGLHLRLTELGYILTARSLNLGVKADIWPKQKLSTRT